MDIYIENANTISKWIKEIFASECNLEMRRQSMREIILDLQVSFKQSVIYVRTLSPSWS